MTFQSSAKDKKVITPNPMTKKLDQIIQNQSSGKII
jgi:hypothetical protein